ncbi:MAG: hypothetical protein QM602_02310 [Microbacterium sp.]
MNRHRVRPLAGAGLALAAATLLIGCAETPEAVPTTPVTTAEPTPSVTSETPSPTPTPVGDPECDTIIPQDVVDSFEQSNWSFATDVFRVGATEVPGGITCTWGDLEVASDNVQMFGWAPIDADAAAQQQDALTQEGWIREDEPEGVYLTENPEVVAAPDDEGYGWTYLFGDGWVTFSDTKQGLLLIEWPPTD